MLLASLSAAGAAGSLAAERKPRREASFDNLMSEALSGRLRFRPDEATRAGRHDFDDRLPDLGPSAIRRRTDELRQQRRLAGLYDPASLPLPQAVELQALIGRLDLELEDLESARIWRTDVPFYASVPEHALADVIAGEFAPPKDRLRGVIGRLDALPDFYATARRNLSNPPKVSTEIAVEDARSAQEFLEGLVALWGREAAGEDGPLLAEFLRSQTKAAAAAREFGSWLESDLLPRSNGNFAVGLEALAERLRKEEAIDAAPLELLRRAEARLEQDRSALLATADRIRTGASPAEARRAISERHPPADRLTVAIVEAIERARAFLREKNLVTIPVESRPVVRTAPPFLRAPGPTAIELPGPEEKSSLAARYDVRPVLRMWDAEEREEHLRTYDVSSNLVRALRDVWPGSYLRVLHRSRLAGRVRAYELSPANAEGWPLYAEEMALERGIAGDDPGPRLVQLSDAVLADARAVAALKLHAAGARFEEVAGMFSSRAFLAEADGLEEARRQAYRPTGIPPLVGKLLIEDLRRDYLAAHRGGLREFHDAFLAEGYLPVPLVRRAMRLR